MTTILGILFMIVVFAILGICKTGDWILKYKKYILIIVIVVAVCFALMCSSILFLAVLSLGLF